jgi:hypothetical protein
MPAFSKLVLTCLQRDFRVTLKGIVRVGRQVRSVPEGDLRRPFQTLVDFSTQQAKVDRLGEQSGCPEFGRPLDGRIVPEPNSSTNADIREPSVRARLGCPGALIRRGSRTLS